MRLLVLTGNRPRHLALAERLGALGEVTTVLETPRTPAVQGPAMRECVRRRDQAEATVFPSVRLPGAVFARPFGEIKLPAPAASYDRIIVFGTSWIREPALSQLYDARALNLHAGLAPEYRGAACNFWAEYDGRPDLVGMTLHRLTAGLDAGPIVRRVPCPRPEGADPWVHGMLAVDAGHQAVVAVLREGGWTESPQLRIRQVRYSKHADYTEEVCAAYLARLGAEVLA